MKKLSIIAVCLFLCTIAIAQQGKVHVYSGKAVFWQNTPVAPYDEVFKFISKIDYGKLQSAQCAEVVNQAIITGGNQKFDAIIITTNNDYDIAIKFKDTTTDNTLCTVKKINNIAYYIDCDPVDRYNVVKTKTEFRKRTDSKRVVHYLSSYQILQKMARKPKATAILIGNDNLHFWISFI